MRANEFVKKFGLKSLKIAVENAPSNAEGYWDGYYFRENPQFQFNNGFHPVWNLTENDGEYFKSRGFNPIPINDLKRLVAAHELVDSYGGVDGAKKYCNYLADANEYFSSHETNLLFSKIKQAIADVESCL